MKIIQDKWLREFLKELRGTTHLKIISPFITENMVTHLLSRWKGNIEVITRFNLNDFRSGISSLDALAQLVENGAKIKGIKDLHSKAYIFDDKSAIITSANFTNGGFFNNFELGIKSKKKKDVDQANGYFKKLWELEDSLLTIGHITEWRQIIDENRSLYVANPLNDYGTSIIRKTLAKKNHFIKFYGTGDERAEWDQDVIDQVAGTHCHFALTFSEGRRPIRYNEGDIVYMARMIRGNEYAIFGKAVARKHDRIRDIASPEDIRHVVWKEHYPIYVRVHSGEFLATDFRHCPKMGRLMDELGYECFRKTKERHQMGEKKRQ